MKSFKVLKSIFALSIASFVCLAANVSGQKITLSSDELFFVAEKKGIYAYRLNEKTGAIFPANIAVEVANPGFLAIHPSKKFLYSVNTAKIDGKNVGVATAFSIESKTGKLTLLNHQPTKGNGPTHLAVDRSGKNILVANYGSGSVSAFPIQKNGSLGSVSAFVQHTGSSINPQRQTESHAHSITTDPGNRFVVSCDLGLDKVLVYKFDASDGSLEPNTPAFVPLKPGAGPRHHAFDSNGKYLYVINELDSTLTAFSYDSKIGALKEIQSVPTLPKDFNGINYPAEVAVHPSGKFLYGSNRGHDSIVVFRIDKKTGMLSLIEHEATQGKFPRHFEIDPSGNYLLAENQDSGNVVVFRIDQKSGELSATGNKLEAEAPQCVKFF